MPMIEAETIKAVQQLFQRRGIQQRADEPLGDYIARGLGVPAGKAQRFLDALHRGCTVQEALHVSEIHDPRLLVRWACAAGTWLGKRRRTTAPAAVRASAEDHLGATENQVSMAGQVPQRINSAGTKVEDLAGTGVHDSSGG